MTLLPGSAGIVFYFRPPSLSSPALSFYPVVVGCVGVSDVNEHKFVLVFALAPNAGYPSVTWRHDVSFNHVCFLGCLLFGAEPEGYVRVKE